MNTENAPADEKPINPESGLRGRLGNFLSDDTVRKSIIASLIASIVVVLFFDYFIGWLISVSIWFGENLYEGLNSGLYKSAALGWREQFSFTLLILFLSLVCGLYIGTMMFYFKTLKEKKRQRQRVAEFVKAAPVEPELLRTELQRLAETPEEKEINLEAPIWRIVIPVLVAVAVLSQVALLFSGFAEMQLNASFHQRMAVLAPHLQDQEEEVLRAHWAMMEKRSDYLEIVRLMEQKANKAQVDLPEALWD